MFYNMKEKFLNTIETFGLFILIVMAWFWEDKEFEITANEAKEKLLSEFINSK